MRILVVSGYAAWDKVSKCLMPSHHLYGVHEIIDKYIDINGKIRGVLKKDVFDEGYVDFYIWKGGKKHIVSQIYELVKLSKDYDLVYDQLNRCSIYLGFLKKCGLFSTKIVTIMHHPPYKLQFRISNSDAYIFFNNDYLELAKKTCRKKTQLFHVNEWKPDIQWYKNSLRDYISKKSDAFFIDNGKSRRDREALLKAADLVKLRIDYAGDSFEDNGWARSYQVDLKDDIGMVRRLSNYKSVVIPVMKNDKCKIGPLGITSYLDCIAIGLPLVASDNVCFSKEIEENGFGVLYKTGDSKSLSDALKTMFDNYDYYKNNICNNSYKDMNYYSERLVIIIKSLY